MRNTKTLLRLTYKVSRNVYGIRKVAFWNRSRCMEEWGFIPYGFADYAEATVSVSPRLKRTPILELKVLLHEIGHVLLGHYATVPYCGRYHKNEVEAETFCHQACKLLGIKLTKADINYLRRHKRKMLKNAPKMKARVTYAKDLADVFILDVLKAT